MTKLLDHDGICTLSELTNAPPPFHCTRRKPPVESTHLESKHLTKPPPIHRTASSKHSHQYSHTIYTHHETFRSHHACKRSDSCSIKMLIN
jgi:hypothetical protein